jgi:hypothetical protein
VRRLSALAETIERGFLDALVPSALIGVDHHALIASKESSNNNIQQTDNIDDDDISTSDSIVKLSRLTRTDSVLKRIGYSIKNKVRKLQTHTPTLNSNDVCEQQHGNEMEQRLIKSELHRHDSDTADSGIALSNRTAYGGGGVDSSKQSSLSSAYGSGKQQRQQHIVYDHPPPVERKYRSFHRHERQATTIVKDSDSDVQFHNLLLSQGMEATDLSHSTLV